MNEIKELGRTFGIALLVGFLALVAWGILAPFLKPATSHVLHQSQTIQIGSNQKYGEATLSPGPDGDHLKVTVNGRIAYDSAVNLAAGTQQIAVGVFDFGGQPLPLTIRLIEHGFDNPAYRIG